METTSFWEFKTIISFKPNQTENGCNQSGESRGLSLKSKQKGRLVAVKQAIDVIPGMTKHTILHAGPPIEFDKNGRSDEGCYYWCTYV